MPALSALLAQLGPLLALDAASAAVQVGVLRPGQPACWERGEGDATSALFGGTATALAAAGLAVGDIRGFVFCEGPGSMLGIRTVAMALRTWQVLQPRPAFAYRSLAVAARHEWARRPRDFAVIADARRDSWHVQPIDASGRLGPPRRVATAELPGGELLAPENFRAWSAPPRALATCPYDVGAILDGLGEADVFRAVDAPDAFQPEAPEYRKWSAQVHSAATAPRR
ncbi:MAG TPA: peptidase M22 [Opitutaceae bacterium]|nr:peptidase M22 [Opitutaceae bacterium]